jgi:hypothetical protein
VVLLTVHISTSAVNGGDGDGEQERQRSCRFGVYCEELADRVGRRSGNAATDVLVGRERS